MSKIQFLKNNRTIIASSDKTLMTMLLENNIPVASSCHGDGVCGKCKLNILNGSGNLSQPTELELILAAKYELNSRQRISCQTFVNGDVTVDATYW